MRRDLPIVLAWKLKLRDVGEDLAHGRGASRKLH
jgi:hypothetical protein